MNKKQNGIYYLVGITVVLNSNWTWLDLIQNTSQIVSDVYAQIDL